MNKFTLLLSVLLLMSFSSEACKCNNYDNSFIHLLESNHVFLATVMAVSECGDNNTYEHQLQVEANYKGILPQNKKVYSDCATSCAFRLKEGDRVIFFSDLNNDNIGFCDLQIFFTDSSFLAIKENLEIMKYTKLDYLEFYENASKTGYKAKLTVQDGTVNGVVKVFNEAGKEVVKGMVKNGKMEGYYEILLFKEDGIERWTGNYENGERSGDWIYKFIPYDEEKENEFILYMYRNGEIIEETMLSIEAQLEKYELKKATAN